MNNFLFEAVCSWSSESVRKPSEKAFRKAFGKAFGKGNTSPCLDRSVKMNPIALLTYYSSGSYWPNPFANIRSEKGECKFFAHYFLLPICQEVLNYSHYNDKNRTT